MSLKKRTRRTSRRKAFTLVELLVVISIIGMLMALLFPAVQAARETARGNTCRSNMRNLALAIMQYEKAKGSYPGYANELHPRNVDPNNASASGDPTVRSWIFMALPYLERNDIYEPYSALPAPPLTWADNAAFLGVQPSQFLEIVQCPSNPPDGLSVAPPTSFVCNTGLPDVTATATTPLDWPHNGVFHDTRPVYNGTGAGATLLPVTRVAEAFVSSGDGTANTMMLTENVDADSWVLTGSASAGTNPPGSTFEFERRLGCNWNATMSTDSSSATVADGIAGPPQEMKINQNLGLDTTFTVADSNGLTYARPSSYHPGLVNVGFCDGHVRTISQDIDYAVMCRLFTPRGRQSRFPGGQVATDPVHRIVPLDEKDLQ